MDTTYYEELSAALKEATTLLEQEEVTQTNASQGAQTSLYYAHGATDKAQTNLDNQNVQAQSTQSEYQAVVRSKQNSDNLLTASKQAVTDAGNANKKISKAAVKFQDAANALAQLSGNTAAMMAIATAADNGSKMYDQVKQTALITQQAANAAEQASLISLSTTIEAAQTIASNVESKATTLNSDLATFEKSLDGQLTASQSKVATDVQDLSAAMDQENEQAGVYETSLRELNAVNASQAYINEVTNYNLQWTDPGLASKLSLGIGALTKEQSGLSTAAARVSQVATYTQSLDTLIKDLKTTQSGTAVDWTAQAGTLRTETTTLQGELDSNFQDQPAELKAEVAQALSSILQALDLLLNPQELPQTLTLPNMGRTMNVSFDAYPSQCGLKAYNIYFIQEKDVKNFNWETASTLPAGYYKVITAEEMKLSTSASDNKVSSKAKQKAKYHQHYDRIYLTQEGVSDMRNSLEAQAAPQAVLDALSQESGTSAEALTEEMDARVLSEISAAFTNYYDNLTKPPGYTSWDADKQQAYQDQKQAEWDVKYEAAYTEQYQTLWLHEQVTRVYASQMEEEVATYRPLDWDSKTPDQQTNWTEKQNKAWVSKFIADTELTWVNTSLSQWEEALAADQVDTKPLVDVNGNAVMRGNTYQVIIYGVDDDPVCNPDVDAGLLSQPSLPAVLAQELYTTTPNNTILQAEPAPITNPCQANADPYGQESYDFLPANYTAADPNRQFYLYMYRDSKGIITTTSIFNISNKAIDRESLPTIMGSKGEQISEYRVFLMRDEDCRAYLANLNAEKQYEKLYLLSYQMGIAQEAYQKASDDLMRYQVQNPNAGPDDSKLIELTLKKQLAQQAFNTTQKRYEQALEASEKANQNRTNHFTFDESILDNIPAGDYMVASPVPYDSIGSDITNDMEQLNEMETNVVNQLIAKQLELAAAKVTLKEADTELQQFISSVLTPAEKEYMAEESAIKLLLEELQTSIDNDPVIDSPQKAFDYETEIPIISEHQQNLINQIRIELGKTDDFQDATLEALEENLSGFVRAKNNARYELEIAQIEFDYSCESFNATLDEYVKGYFQLAFAQSAEGVSESDTVFMAQALDSTAVDNYGEPIQEAENVVFRALELTEIKTAFEASEGPRFAGEFSGFSFPSKVVQLPTAEEYLQTLKVRAPERFKTEEEPNQEPTPTSEDTTPYTFASFLQENFPPLPSLFAEIVQEDEQDGGENDPNSGDEGGTPPTGGGTNPRGTNSPQETSPATKRSGSGSSPAPSKTEEKSSTSTTEKSSSTAASKDSTVTSAPKSGTTASADASKTGTSSTAQPTGGTGKAGTAAPKSGAGTTGTTTPKSGTGGNKPGNTTAKPSGSTGTKGSGNTGKKQ